MSASSLLAELLAPESLDGIDCVYCKRKRGFKRSIDIWRCPPYLILTLNRFVMDFATVRKNNAAVQYSDSIDLEELMAAEAPLQDSCEYELYGVVEHEGTVNRGHYTAMIKVDSEWRNVNDGRISKIDQSTAVNSKNAYMLFYRWKGALAVDDLD